MKPLSDAVTGLAGELFASMKEPQRTMCRIQFVHGKILVRQEQGRDCATLIAMHDQLMADLNEEAPERPPLVGIEVK